MKKDIPRAKGHCFHITTTKTMEDANIVKGTFLVNYIPSLLGLCGIIYALLNWFNCIKIFEMRYYKLFSNAHARDVSVQNDNTT